MPSPAGGRWHGEAVTDEGIYTSSDPEGTQNSTLFSFCQRIFRRDAALHLTVDRLANTWEILPNITIGKPQDIQPLPHQPSAALPVTGNALFFKVLCAIQLNCQLGPCTVEIHNKPANHLLPLKLDRIGFEKIIPEMPFFPCRVLTQFLCSGPERCAAFHTGIPFLLP